MLIALNLKLSCLETEPTFLDLSMGNFRYSALFADVCVLMWRLPTIESSGTSPTKSSLEREREEGKSCLLSSLAVESGSEN